MTLYILDTDQVSLFQREYFLKIGLQNKKHFQQLIILLSVNYGIA